MKKIQLQNNGKVKKEVVTKMEELVKVFDDLMPVQNSKSAKKLRSAECEEAENSSQPSTDVSDEDSLVKTSFYNAIDVETDFGGIELDKKSLNCFTTESRFELATYISKVLNNAVDVAHDFFALLERKSVAEKMIDHRKKLKETIHKAETGYFASYGDFQQTMNDALRGLQVSMNYWTLQLKDADNFSKVEIEQFHKLVDAVVNIFDLGKVSAPQLKRKRDH